MAKQRNINAKITLMNSAGTAPELELGCSAKEASIELKRDEIEVTTICDTGKQFIVGPSEGSFKLSVYMEDGTYSASNQKALRDVWVASVARHWRIHENGDGAGKPEKTFDAVMTSLSEPISVGEALMMELEFRISGDVTYTTQS